MTHQPLYLSSLDSERFAPVRECRFLRPITVGAEKAGMLVSLSPGVIGQDFGSSEDFDRFVLTPRFEGANIREIPEFPCFVFIALPNASWNWDADRADAADLDVIGWGELYRTATDAEVHRFE